MHSFEAALAFRQAVMKLPLKKGIKETRSFFTKEELKILFSLPGTSKIEQRNKTILIFMYASGARAQEVCDLQVGDITFSKDKAFILLRGKGSKHRRISIPKKPASHLKQYLEDTGRIIHSDWYVFTSQTRSHMTISCIEEVYKKYLFIAKKQYPSLFAQCYSPHSMRHTTATHMIEADIPLIVIKNFLVHSSITTTQVYCEISQGMLDKRTDEWNRIWMNIGTGCADASISNRIPDFLR